MRIVDLLSKESIMLNGTPKTKSEAIDMLVDLQVKSGKIADKAEYKKGILAREQMSSTAVGEGIAIPHAKSTAVKAPSLAAMTVPSGVDYEALDEEPSNLLFMLLLQMMEMYILRFFQTYDNPYGRGFQSKAYRSKE